MATGMPFLSLRSVFGLVLIHEEIVDEYTRLINSVRVSDSLMIIYLIAYQLTNVFPLTACVQLTYSHIPFMENIRK